jgi:hypothetical protein
VKCIISVAAEEAMTGVREGFDKAQADARQALALAPGNAEVLAEKRPISQP